MSVFLRSYKDESGKWAFAACEWSPSHVIEDIDTVDPAMRRPFWDGVRCPMCERTHWLAELGPFWSCPTCGGIYEVATITAPLDCDGAPLMVRS